MTDTQVPLEVDFAGPWRLAELDAFDRMGIPLDDVREARTGAAVRAAIFLMALRSNPDVTFEQLDGVEVRLDG